ncbi:MAG: hypothetical protein ACNA8N_01240, partial [Trueperaceae bacterium]
MPTSITTGLRWLALASLLVTAVAAAQPQALRAAGITVTAELLASDGDATIAFRLALDTHAGDLLGYDLMAAATLERGDGTAIEGAFSYHPESESGHHREGVLRFAPAPAADATPPFELVLRGVGAPEWRFRWEAPAATPSGGATP